MRPVFYIALSMGMLLSLPWPGCAYDVQTDSPTKAGSVHLRDRDPNRVSRAARIAADKAAALQKKQTENDLNAAIPLFRESARLYKAAASYSQAAESLLQLGDVYFTLSRYERALTVFSQILNLAPKDRELRSRALSRMARVYATMGQSSLAEKYAQQALSQSDGVSITAQAGALEAAGEFYRGSDEGKATELFRRAGELFAQAGNKGGEAQSLLMLAFIQVRSNRQEAFRLAAQALQLWSAENDLRGIAWVRRALGIFAAISDEFETARCNCQQALPAFRRIGDKDNEAAVLNVMGYASLEMGDAQASLDYYRRAEAIFAGLHDLLGRVESVTGMGRALAATGQYGRLVSLYELKLRLAQQTKNGAQIASTLAELAAVYERQHQYQKSETFYRRSLAAYDALSLDYGIGDALIGLAHVRAGQGQDSEAIAFLQQALPRKDKAGQIEDVARIYYEISYFYRRLHRLGEAREAIEKTVGIIESQRLTISHFDSRASYFASVHRYYALYIQVLMLLHQHDPQQHFMQLAFEASEKSKVRALLDLLTASSQDSPCDELLRRQLAPSDATEVQVANVKQPASPAPVLLLPQIQAQLEDGGILLEYALGDEKSYLWVVDRNGIVAHELPPAGQARKMVQTIRNALVAREQLPSDKTVLDYRNRVQEADQTYRRTARDLSTAMLGSADLGSDKRLLIVPDGPLQYIPFSALPLPESNERNPFLVSHHEIVVLPSASALGTLRTAALNRPKPSSAAAVFADPVFELDDPRVALHRGAVEQTHPPRLRAALRDVKDVQHIPRLPGSEAEAGTIRQTLGRENVVVVKGFDATRDYVLKANLSRYWLIHFATHGIIDARDPEMSGLILSLIDERGKRQDGYLRLGDIYGLKLSADLVVLSSCESGLGKDLESEGMIGLPRAFLYAGARCVVASLWKVDDDVTGQFMKGFYARLQRGEGPSAALQDAQIEMSRDSKWSNPFYWAAFVLQGDCK